MKHDYGRSPVIPLAFFAGGALAVGTGLILGGRAIIRRVRREIPRTPTSREEVPETVLSPVHEALADPARQWAGVK